MNYVEFLNENINFKYISMAVMRQAPKCYKCGEPIAKAIYKDESKTPPMQRLIGDTFIRWDYIEHECVGETTNENSVLNLQNVVFSEAEVCLTCQERPQSAGSEYCGECIDEGRYPDKQAESEAKVCCGTCKYNLPEGRCGHPQGCEGEYELWEQQT